MASQIMDHESEQDVETELGKAQVRPLDPARSAAVDIPNTRPRKKSILISSPRDNKHTRRKSVQISLSPASNSQIQSKSWQPASTEPQLTDASSRRRRGSRSRSKSVNLAQMNHLIPEQQRAQSLMIDEAKSSFDKSRRRRRSRSGSKSFNFDDDDQESPALHSVQEMISSLKQIPIKSNSDHSASIRTSSPTSLDPQDAFQRDMLKSRHVPCSPTSPECMFPAAKSWSSIDSYHQHDHNSTGSLSHRLNSYQPNRRKESVSSYASSSATRDTPHAERSRSLSVASIQSTDTNESSGRRRSVFQAHLPHAEVLRQLDERQLFRGILSVDEQDCSDAYVICDDLDAHVYVYGSRNRNRALHGDAVAIRLVDVDLTLQEKATSRSSREGRSLSTRRSSIFGLSWTEIKEEKFENGCAKTPKYCGVVVAILERLHNLSIAGTLVRQRPTPISKESLESPISETFPSSTTESKSSSNIVWLRPRDKKLPLVAIPVDQAPEGFLHYHEEYQKRLFVATIRRWPANALHPFGTLDREIGLIGELVSEEKAILADNNIHNDGFSEQSLKCLPAVPWPIPIQEMKLRRDVNGPGTRVFTMSRDFKHAAMDVAISIAHLNQDVYEVGVHAADVSYFVKPKSAIDKEARDRALLVRLEDKAIPMLPDTLHKNLCSFRAGRKRLGFSVIWTMDLDGRIHDTWFGKTILKSGAQFSFAQVQSVLEGNPLAESIKLHDCVSTDMESGLRDMAKFASSLRQRRLGLNPSAIGQKTKLTFELNANGFPESISTQTHCQAQDAYQELCIMANVSVAQKNTKHFPDHALLRRQDPIIDTLLKSFAPNDADLDMNSLSKDAFEAALLGLTKTEEQTLLRFLAGKSARPGLYFSAGTTDINKYFHHGHGISLYTHFTSPVCRYAAIIVHRQLEAALKQDKEMHGDKENIEKLVLHCNVRENACRNASEQSARLYLCSYLNRQTLTASNCVESACVFSIQNDSIDIYIPAYDMRQRLHFDDITAKHSYDAESNSVTLFWPIEESKYGAGDDELLLEDVEADLPNDQSTAWSSAMDDSLQVDTALISTHDATTGSIIVPNGTQSVAQIIRRMSKIDASISVDMNVSPPVIIVDVINPTTKQ